MEGHDASLARPKEQDFNAHLAYLIQSTAMVSDPWFWPVIAEIYERAEPVLSNETEQYLARGAALDPEITVLELSRRFAELIDGDGGITHRQNTPCATPPTNRRPCSATPDVVSSVHPSPPSSLRATKPGSRDA
eukprot:4357115-Pleurochrysis_carterae.AAC.1